VGVLGSGPYNGLPFVLPYELRRQPVVSVGLQRGKMSVVDVELLVVPDCPNESVALSMLRLAFDRVGLAAQPVPTTVIASQEQAQERGFVGSPTILIKGVDPFGVAAQSPAYACRVYATSAGLSGVPPLGDVISALTAASNREPASPRMSCPHGVHR
jgi:hypothetical protein